MLAGCLVGWRMSNYNTCNEKQETYAMSGTV